MGKREFSWDGVFGGNGAVRRFFKKKAGRHAA